MERRRAAIIVILSVAALVITVLGAPAPASPAQWRFEDLDGHVDGPNGEINSDQGSFSTSVVWGGTPHVWYYECGTVEADYSCSNGDLRHAWWTGSAWFFETLDGDIDGTNGEIDADVGMYSRVTVWAGTPHVWYYDLTNGDLRHAWWTGSAWFFETLDGDIDGTNGEIDSDLGSDIAVTVWNGQPHVWYYDVALGDLRHAWWTGSAWFFETLDGDIDGTNGEVESDVGLYNAVTVWNGTPHLWYQDFDSRVLRHAWWTGSAWFFETLDGDIDGTNGEIVANLGGHVAVTVWNRQPHVWYYDEDSGDLRHAWWTGRAWFFETLDGDIDGTNGEIDANVGEHSAVTVWNGTPHVWYQDYDNGDLRHAWWTGRAWFFETLDGAIDGTNGEIDFYLGSFNSVTVWNRQPHVWYFDEENADLRHAWYG